MKKIFYLICAFILIKSSDVFSQQKKDSIKIQSYKLIWSDEFDKDGKPDSSNWSYETGFERNQELQWYQPDNAYCKNGYLIIEAKRESKPNPNFDSISNNWRKNRKNIQYTSACLISREKKSWKYGRFEMRAKIDVSDGMWPAWWTLGIQRAWPANGEIDIMEYYRNKLLANVVCLGSQNKQEWHSTKTPLSLLGDSSWSSKFHIWRMDWDENILALYVDDSLLNKVAIDSLVNKDGSAFNPFKQPHYMLLNLAVGGQNGGNPEETSFPRYFIVDFVRVYQKK